MDSKRRSLSPELSADDRLATFYLQSSAMLSLLDSYGVQVLANATYNRDFVAVRQRSLLNGSLYEFKRLPELDDTGGYGFKGRLWDYVAVVFGEVQETFADVVSSRRLEIMEILIVTQNSGRIHIRLRCPDQASCAVARLHQLQQSALQSILTEDQKHLVRFKLGYAIDLIVQRRTAVFHLHSLMARL
jgi:hypothetical protein